MKISRLFKGILAITVCSIFAGSCQSEIRVGEPSDEPAGEMSSAAEGTEDTGSDSVPEAPEPPPPPTLQTGPDWCQAFPWDALDETSQEAASSFIENAGIDYGLTLMDINWADAYDTEVLEGTVIAANANDCDNIIVIVSLGPHPTPPPPPPTPTAAPTPLPAGPNVIVASQGVLGWTLDGEWIEVSDPSSIPAEEGDLYRVLRTGNPTSIDIPGSAPVEGCGPLPGSTAEIAIDDPLFNADGWPYTYPIAISSNWDLTPHDVESLSLESEIYKGFASEVLADVEIIDPDPNLITLIRTDLEGDGVDEVIVGAERISGSLISPSPGDYSIVFIRKIVGGDVTQQLIAGDVFVDAGSGLLYSARLVAVADLNGDNRMEITIQYGYYEGSSTHVLEYKNDVEGLQQVLVVGCGA